MPDSRSRGCPYPGPTWLQCTWLCATPTWPRCTWLRATPTWPQCTWLRATPTWPRCTWLRATPTWPRCTWLRATPTWPQCTWLRATPTWPRCTWLRGPMAMKSSTCMDGGRLVFCFRNRKVSLPRPVACRIRIAEVGGQEGRRDGRMREGWRREGGW